jgi:CRP-like cAMP-binding protein
MSGNRILALLPPRDAKRLAPRLEPLSLPVRKQLYEPNQRIRHVYFLDRGVASVTIVLQEEQEVEIATVGNEGMIGVPVFLGVGSSTGKAFIQIAGEGSRMSASALRAEIARGGALHRLLERYTHGLFAQVAHSAGCNRLHRLEQRCSRWLLMTHDRVASDEFPLTQDFLARMLGVRRATVTEAVGSLQRAGLIHYRRRQVAIIDRAGLEAASCNCYAAIRQEFDRLSIRTARERAESD